MGLSLENIHKHVNGENHLTGIHLRFSPGSRNVILGRTLAGKTSLLRIMAGLDRPTRGNIRVNGKDVTGHSVRKRSVAMVYPQFINYPAFTVFDNIAAPLKVTGVPRPEIKERVMAVARLLQLESTLGRLPAELPQGMQQRCAIARALVKEAHLLLLDEPLINLDYKLRESLQEELQAMFEHRKTIIVYATTEPTEALKLGGNIVVLDRGRVLQTGRTPHVYRNPGTLRVAEVFSDPPINYLPVTVENGQAHIGDTFCFSLFGHLDDLPNDPYTFGIRANHISFHQQSAQDMELALTIDLCEINGSETFVHGHLKRTKLVMQAVGIHTIKHGSMVPVFINPRRFFVYSDTGILVKSPDAPDPDTVQE